jgi:hypothetical protein
VIDRYLRASYMRLVDPALRANQHPPGRGRLDRMSAERIEFDFGVLALHRAGDEHLRILPAHDFRILDAGGL